MRTVYGILPGEGEWKDKLMPIVFSDRYAAEQHMAQLRVCGTVMPVFLDPDVASGIGNGES